ncbi:GNAT family N-acetyltransferase [Paenibacillus sp. JX-17]|uniref:GNAT family N-acetyltransferase n=1 Tax=Paenibacillus lacisoli TaxID=3064525 RepID=A0ABT9CH92_9BACL|nr:GNAT family N-acetyltransferase [Paenibacillus sp. JX-17]MDO7907031.1 GNAT family N-acetyltransferase [Paenibacillus sp. JX-17]
MTWPTKLADHDKNRLQPELILTKSSIREVQPVLHHPLLTLMLLSGADYERLLDMVSHPEVIRYVNRASQPLPIRARKLVMQIKDSALTMQSLHFGIWEKATGKFAGLVSFQFWNELTGEAQVGYILGRDWWGRGYATASLKLLLQFGFSRLGLHDVEARCHPDNSASLRVLVKNGLTFGRVIAPYAEGDGGVPVHVYKLTRNQWMRQKM